MKSNKINKGDIYEYNTVTRKQYILEVEDVEDDVILFKAFTKEDYDNDDLDKFFQYDLTKENLDDMIKRNNINLISKV